MKIIVCVKQIYHTYARTGTDPDKMFIAPEDTVARINPYDEAALETALCFKDLDPETEITLLTLGPLIAESGLRRCLAMGADNLVQIDAERQLDSKNKSEYMAKAVEEIGADIVLCGKESLDTQNGQVGAFLARILNVPFVSVVLEFRLKSNNIEVIRSAGRGVRERIECPVPVVLSVDMGQKEPRLPTYMSKKKAEFFQIQTLSYYDSEMNKQKVSHDVFPPRPRPKKAAAPDSSLDPYNRIDFLLTGTRVEKKGAVLRGDAEVLADGIVSFLDEHGFLNAEKAE
ncbi:MAG: hypothetical protein JW864_03105 [Spirochaetes bacterium]|nr:hypothetical protein [Spirochaetota bacterium]